MTQRVEDGVTWTQVFDAENHLVSVTNNSTATTTSYIYDGDGARVRRRVTEGSGAITTIYVMGMEVELSEPMSGMSRTG